MRDAFGGAFMIKLFLVFIFIYICFTAVALNYAKAFKVKNKVIDYLESNEITNLDDINGYQEQEMENFFENEILGNMNYRVNVDYMCNGIEQYNDAEPRKRIAYCSDIGIVIRQREKTSGQNTEGVYYTVSTYVGWSIPFLNKLLELNGNNKEQDTVTGLWRISGETRLIVNE